jgi:DNA-binding transcriptional ArsR family regulator
LDAEAAARVAGRFRALGDPTRLGLAVSLRGDRELCVCDLSWIAERAKSPGHTRGSLGIQARSAQSHALALVEME